MQFNLLDTGVKAPYVGERSVESGRILGQKVVEKLGGASATGKVIIGNCFPGFPVLENRSKGVREALAAAPGLVTMTRTSTSRWTRSRTYAAWEALLTANPDAMALIGLCASGHREPRQAPGGRSPRHDFVAGGYDLTAENLAALEAGTRTSASARPRSCRATCRSRCWTTRITGATTSTSRPGGFLDAGTEIVTADCGHRAVRPARRSRSRSSRSIAADPEAARAYYQPLVDGVIADWATNLEPIENESK